MKLPRKLTLSKGHSEDALQQCTDDTKAWGHNEASLGFVQALGSFPVFSRANQLSSWRLPLLVATRITARYARIQ